MILAILLVSLLAISAVSASENVTSNDISTDDMAEGIDLKSNDINNEKVTNNHEILKSSNSQDVISINNDEDVLSTSSPYYSYYSVNVYDTTINYGSSGTISMSINPCTYSGYYAYDFYLMVYDSNDNTIIEKNYYSTSLDYSKVYTVGSGELSPGTYTIEIVNYEDDIVMDTATLNIKSQSS